MVFHSSIRASVGSVRFDVGSDDVKLVVGACPTDVLLNSAPRGFLLCICLCDDITVLRHINTKRKKKKKKKRPRVRVGVWVGVGVRWRNLALMIRDRRIFFQVAITPKRGDLDM